MHILRKIQIAVGLLLLSLPLLGNFKAFAATTDQLTFHTVTYGRSAGLDSCEINAFTQMEDGFIWVGTYSGLFRFDGKKFLKENLADEINSVKTLYADSAGNLWIGTNDSGLFRYNPGDGSVYRFSTANGLATNYVHSMAEDPEGNLYIGTGENICVVRGDSVVKTYSSMPDIRCVVSMEWDPVSDSLVGITSSGLFFSISGDRYIYSEMGRSAGTRYTSLDVMSDGTIFIGTSGSELWLGRMKNGQLAKIGCFGFTELTYMNLVRVDEESGYILVASNNSFGIVNLEGNVIYCSPENYNNDSNTAMIDYQGNAWFGTDIGVFKVAKNLFGDLFAGKGVTSATTNAIVKYRGNFYIASDKGLVIIDSETGELTGFDTAIKFADTRIRGLLVDSHDRLWLATYGSRGLVCMDGSDIVAEFNERNSDLEGSIFRSVYELSDGTIVTASNTALNFIKDMHFSGLINKDWGLNAQILTLVETDNGDVLAGSDGDGIYIIRNGKIVGRIAEEQGLENQVVLRIVKYKDSFIYASSGSLYYDDGSHASVRKLKKFPYGNNFDILFDRYDNAWITGGMGVIVAKLRDIVDDKEEYPYTIYDESYGLETVPSSNSWNYTEDGEEFYLCTTSGVRHVKASDLFNTVIDFNIGIGRVTFDESIAPEPADGVYTIPRKVKRIEIRPSIMNYRINNPLVRVYLEGFDDVGIVKFQNELDTVSYTNLPYGEYVLHIQILSMDGAEVQSEVTYIIDREGYLYEHTWFRIFSFIVAALLFSVIVGLLLRRKNLHALRKEKERILSIMSYRDPMTGALNRRALDEKADGIEKGSTVALLFGDIMGLKKVNDEQGHEQGDALIMRAYEGCSEVFRKDDIFRVGGDEFVIMCEEMSETEMQSRVSELDEILKKNDAEMALGYVWTANYDGNYREIQRLADTKMYADKKARYAATGYVRSHV